ncbi:hypothetical protein RND81_03G138500 [Saponaria officinalis]|uniref:Protein LNK2 n=1 Tax=Saponaria officinalis TaxID=3572 RepID=A0AAW1M048_SAPOF
MFDWEDQELANILWGEGREADDHIVPYPEDIENKDLLDYGDNDKKELNQEDANIKGSERSPSTSKLFSDEAKQKKKDGVFASGTIMDSQLDSPSFATPKTDGNSTAKETKLDTGPQDSGDHQEDKELGEFVGNSWANIASFDDLDRIFSNDEVDGHTSLGSADELWSPSKGLIREEAKSSSEAMGSRSWEFEALGSTSSQIELNSEYMHDEYPSEATSCGKPGSIMSNSERITGRFVEQEYTVGTSALKEEKNDWRNNQPKYQQITDKKTNSVLSGHAYETWPSIAANVPHYDGLSTPATEPNIPPAVPSQQWLPHGSRPIAYQHITNTYTAPYAFKNFPQQHSSTHLLKRTNDEHRSIRTGYEAGQSGVISFKKPVETAAKPIKMTPQEKIEKLRRRQQMRAMLAIQKQQEQLSRQAGHAEYLLTQKSCQEEQILDIEKAALESDEGKRYLRCSDSGSSNNKDDLCTVSDMDVYSVEDTVIYKLQDIVSRLDTKTRLCIKDSLYRLAQSATQRHYASDTSAANMSSPSDPEIAREQTINHHRIVGNANVETETNHIDRAVAHLLFHRPFKSSVKHTDTLQSSTSGRACPDQDIAGSHLQSGLLASEKNINLPLNGPKSSQPSVDSCIEDVQEISHTKISVNPQTKRKMSELAD